MKILHAISQIDSKLGGSVHAALSICEFLNMTDNSAYLISTIASSDDQSYIGRNYPKVKFQVFRRSFPQRYCNSEAVRLWLRSNTERFDIVEVHGVFSMVPLIVSAACKKYKVPYIVRPHGSLDPFDLKKHYWFKRLIGPIFIRPMLANAAAVHLTAGLEADRLETYGASVQREVIPLPVKKTDKAGDGPAFRKKHNIPSDALVVLFLSRIDYKKGLELLIPSLASLKVAHPALWFVLGGTGESAYLNTVRHLIAEHQMEDWTTECGFLSGETKQAAFAASDLFVLPSLNENFGIVIVEAMNAGLPVLVSSEVYIHQEISRAGAGVVCDPSMESCERTLRSMIADKFKLRRMGETANAFAQISFSPKAATESLLNLYRRILKRRK